MKNKITLLFSFFIFITTKNIFADTTDFLLTDISDARKKLLEYALNFEGTPYVWGGTTPKGFDCSGFVYYVFNNGLNYPLSRDSKEQYAICVKIDDKDREPGDLLFFKDLTPGKISHVGIYYGLYIGSDSKLYGKEVFLSAVSEGPRTGITLAATDEKYWKKHFLGYGRILNGSSERYIVAANIHTKGGDKAKTYKVAKAKKASPSSQNIPSSLSGRKGIYLSANMEMQKFSSNYFNAPYINNIYISYLGSIGKYFFYGAKAGINTQAFTQTPVFSVGIEGGANFNLLDLLIPYAEIGVAYKTNQDLELKIGGGLDIKISKLIITLGYDYTFPFNITKIKEDGILNGKDPNFHSLSFGIGYAL